jgi:DNA-binding SARP family transcriptional activator
VRSALLRLPSLLVAIVALGALGVLARVRPGFPEAPASLASPVTTAFLQEVVIVAAWLLAALVALLLVVDNVRRTRLSRNDDFDRPNLLAGEREVCLSSRSRSTVGPLRAPIDEPRLLIGIRPEPQGAPLDHGDGGSSKPAASVVAEHDLRPLISLLGPVTINGGKRSRRGLRASALELIAFLALRREGAQRDEILEALWSGDDPKRSRHRLYQAVRDARRLLGEAVASERDYYWLDRDRVGVDVDELEEVLTQARDLGSDDQHKIDGDARRRELLERALSLLRGDPLAGSDYAWAGGEQRRLTALRVDLLERLGRLRLESGDALGALELAEQAAGLDGSNEHLAQLAMEAEGALGRREAVVERYARLRLELDERFGLEPTRETRALYRRLLGQDTIDRRAARACVDTVPEP